MAAPAFHPRVVEGVTSEYWRDVLTPREAGTTALVALGWTQYEVAEAQSVSVGTVKFHIANALRKTDTRNRVELARWWWLNVETPSRRMFGV